MLRGNRIQEEYEKRAFLMKRSFVNTSNQMPFSTVAAIFSGLRP